MNEIRSKIIDILLMMLLALPILDISLTLMLVRSIRDGEPETGLFATFYIQMAATEIPIRWLIKSVRKDTVYRWYYWASWICRWALILQAVLSIAHIIVAGSAETLLIPYIYDSRLWIDMAILPLRWISALCGMILMLGRKETRKKTLLTCLIGLPVSFFLLGMLGSVSDRDSTVSNFFANVCFLWVPRMLALGGALFDPLFGRKIREKERTEKKKLVPSVKRPTFSFAPSGARPASSPVSSGAKPASSSASPRRAKMKDERPAEERLAQQKEAYERRMVSRELGAREADARETAEEMPFDEAFEKTAVRLYSEGRAAAALGGQRQLVYWMAGAVPLLHDLLRQPVGKAFYAPSLSDDPEVFLPVLEELLREVIRLLESSDGTEDPYGLENHSPESLCAGWYALTRYAAVTKSTALANEAERLKTYFRKDRACNAWLRRMNRAAEEGEG